MCDARGAAHDMRSCGRRKSFPGKRFLGPNRRPSSPATRAAVDGSAACALDRPLHRRIGRSDLVALAPAEVLKDETNLPAFGVALLDSAAAAPSQLLLE